jgi:hypothetical protein
MAITCGVTQGRTIDCADVVGGLKAVYFAASFQDLPVVADVTSGVMSGLPADNGSTTGNYTVYRYELRPELSSMTINIQGDTNNGTVFYEQSLSLQFHKLASGDADKIVELAKGRLNTFVLDNNDNLYVLGAENGLDLSGGNLTTGTSFGDANGFQLELSGRELYPVYFFTAPSDPSAATFPFDGTGATVSGVTAVVS